MTQIIKTNNKHFIFAVCFVYLFGSVSGWGVENLEDFYPINSADDYLDNLIVEPLEIIRKANERSKRAVSFEPYEKLYNDALNSPDKITIKVEEWMLVLEENKYISFGENFKEFWTSVDEDGEKKSKETSSKEANCKFYTGAILYEADSQAIITICESKFYYGFFSSQGKSFIIEPIEEPYQSHIIYKAKLLSEIDERSNDDALDKPHNNSVDAAENVQRFKRELKQIDSFNLTGDTILDDVRYNFEDEDVIETPVKKYYSSEDEEDDQLNNSYNYDDYDYDLSSKPKWHKVKKYEEEELGYFVDTQWQTRTYTRPGDRKSSDNPTKTERWLEIALAVDYTVIDFHGKTKIKQYIMALMNIVSAIYKDASLDANLHLVLARLIFYDDKKDSVIRQGNAKKSLEDVNRWNYKLIGRLPRNERPHDVAVWLTREYLGGPSGYAPVAGVCDRSRSTALNKDEGLASAFIIAHEMAHILGLTHDGDIKAGNKCDNEVPKGTIMAPTVSANFHRFTWSSCSKEEFHRLVRQWYCLLNPPEGKNHTIITPGTTESFTMDEQCRMEYGEGYGLCRNFELIEPCTYLWCGQKDSMQCITKKGAPAEGTQCGFDKWCVDGYCQDVDGRLYGTGVPRDGGWGQWSEWSQCSSPCGYGVKIRRRSCDNPSPAWGGADCKGPSEEKETCQHNRQCWEAPASDIRADKCNMLSKEGRRNGTWLPYEGDDEEDLSCRESCMLWNTGEVVRNIEFVPDGTPCSYDNPHHICVDGRCKKLGCDGIEGSQAVDDRCGVCQGNGDSCFDNRLVFHKTQKKNMTRLLVLPRHSRNIRMRVTLRYSKENNRILPFSVFHLTLRNKNKKLFKIDYRNENDVIDIPKPSSDYLSPVWSNYQIGPSIVLAGSAFIAGRPPGMLTLSAKGPLHSDVVVMLNSPSEYLYVIESNVEANYTLGKQDVGRYRWLLEEHIPCQCGSVPKPLPIYCVDTRRGNRTVHGSHCSRAIKPRARVQNCKSCDFHWIPGPWENCTTACGRNGTSHRQIYCVPKSLGFETPVMKLIKFMVEPQYCTNKPVQEQPCNVFSCPAYWEEGPWTRCSSSCGPGMSSRPLTCDSPVVEECGEMPPTRWRTCRSQCSKNPAVDNNCRGDKSPYCALTLLYRYCAIPSYKKLCCATCGELYRTK